MRNFESDTPLFPSIFPAIAAGLGAVAGGVISGIFGQEAAEEQAEAIEGASEAELQAQREALEENRRQFDLGLGEVQRQYDVARGDVAPYREAGVSALNLLSQGIQPGGEFNQPFTAQTMMQDPGYQFRVQEGQRALERSQSARGGLLGGRAMREATRYGQEMASNEYANAFNRYQADLSNRFNRLAYPTGLGQTSAMQMAGTATGTGAQVANLAQNYGTNAANLALAGGATRGSAYEQAGNVRAAQLANLGSSINTGIGGAISAYNAYNNQRLLEEALRR